MRQSPAINSLTPREKEVLALLAQGLSSKEIARSIHRSVSTVKTHRQSISAKLGVRNRIALARMADAAGLSAAAPDPQPESGPADPPAEPSNDIRRTLNSLKATIDDVARRADEILGVQRRCEQQLRRLKLIFEHLPLGVLVTDSTGTIEDANLGARRLLSIGENADGELKLVTRFTRSEAADFERRLRSALDGATPEAWTAHLLSTKGRPPPPVEINVAAAGSDGDECAASVVWVLRPIPDAGPQGSA